MQSALIQAAQDHPNITLQPHRACIDLITGRHEERYSGSGRVWGVYALDELTGFFKPLHALRAVDGTLRTLTGIALIRGNPVMASKWTALSVSRPVLEPIVSRSASCSGLSPQPCAIEIAPGTTSGAAAATPKIFA